MDLHHGLLGSLIRRAAVAACLTVAAAARVLAQQPLAEPPSSGQFLSRYDFHLSAAALDDNDPRFKWDTHWGGDFDLVDYVHGRTMLLADYEAVLGDQLRPFDPNQGNYFLEASSSLRVGKTEFAGVLHHESRHLSDRPKTQAVAWNVAAVRVLRQVDIGTATLALRVDAGPVIERAYVDYTWMATGEAVLRRALTPHVGLLGRATGDFFGVDPAIAGRSDQKGGHLEAGVRLSGSRGAVELFAGYERVVDAYPLGREPGRWPFAGFRIVN
jgi:hypothetical protein